MTDPQRLLDGAGDEIEVALLRSAKPDAPSRRSMRRTLTALGIAGAATAAGIAAASTPSAAGGAVVGVTKSSGLALIKWVGIAAFGGFALWGVSHQMNDEAPMVQRAVASQARALAGAAQNTIGHPRLVAVPKFSRDPAREPESTEAAAPPRERVPNQGGDLTAEVAQLDEARKKLDKDPKAALAAMDAYDDKFKKDGALGQEADVLRIEALARAGQNERARALGNAFLARHPSSPLAQRVRSLLASLKSE